MLYSVCIVMMLLFTLAFTLATHDSGVEDVKWVVLESVGSHPSQWIVQRELDDARTELELKITVHENKAMIEQILHELSTPGSANYGKHLTKEQVTDLAMLHEDKEIIQSWIRGFPDQQHVHYKDTDKDGKDVSHILVMAPVATWDKVLNTKFSHYKLEGSSEVIIRATSYSVPAAVAGSVHLIHPTTSFPTKMHHNTKEGKEKNQGTRETPLRESGFATIAYGVQ